MEGWIKIHRKMREWQYYQCPSVMMVFIDLLLAANSKERYYHGKAVKRGETCISVASLMQNTGLSKPTVLRALKMLEDSGEIKRVKFFNCTKTIVLNYAKYQDVEDDSGKNILPPTLPPTLPLTLPLALPEQEGKKDKNNNILYNNITSPSNEEDVSSMTDDPSNQQQQHVDFEGLKNFFNQMMANANSVIPHIVSIKGKREGAVRARIREYGLDKVYEMITKASRSDFLNGKNSRGWRADFSWLFLPSNFQKVLEGNYDNGNNSQQQNRQSGQVSGRTQAEDPLARAKIFHA